jgi:hypothetical protein
MRRDDEGLTLSIDLPGGELKIAKRGLPGTPQAKTWVTLEPGWIVRDRLWLGQHEIEVEYRPSSKRQQS